MNKPEGIKCLEQRWKAMQTAEFDQKSAIINQVFERWDDPDEIEKYFDKVKEMAASEDTITRLIGLAAQVGFAAMDLKELDNEKPHEG